MARYREFLSDLETNLKNLMSQSSNAYETGGNGWHDNASFEHLLEDIHFANSRFAQARSLLVIARILPYPANPERAMYGARVQFLFDGENREVEIVGHGEEDYSAGRVLYLSPLAQALIPHAPGDVYTKEVGDKVREIEIIAVGPLRSLMSEDK